MDDTLCDYRTAFDEAKRMTGQKFPQAQYDFFRKLDPIYEAVHSINCLNRMYDVWILTRPSVQNPGSYTEKRLWVEDHLGMRWVEKLIMCPNKALMKGDYLIDDVPWPLFEGEQLLFGKDNPYPTWKSVLDKLL